jgi:hypothetical protein
MAALSCSWRYFDGMSSDGDLADLIGRKPDPALLADAVDLLPHDVGRPAPIPEDQTHERIVGVGAALTGISLIGGGLLIPAGVVVAAANGDVGGLALIMVILGVLLVATHWGWVHFAEIYATRRDERRLDQLNVSRESWLERVEPYARFTITTSVADDGGIVIERVAHIPRPVGKDRFSFERYVERREVHSGEEPGAEVAEHAELLRREAAADTERERVRYEAARDALDDAALRDADEAERLAVVRAASQALSERINERMREPPLIE